MKKLTLQNKGYYYELIDEIENIKIYKQFDDDPPNVGRFVAYELHRNNTHWKTVKTLERANEIISKLIKDNGTLHQRRVE